MERLERTNSPVKSSIFPLSVLESCIKQIATCERCVCLVFLVGLYLTQSPRGQYMKPDMCMLFIDYSL